MITKYVEDLAKEIIKVMASNCGRHLNPSCKLADEQLIKDTEEKIKNVIQKQLELLFDHLSKNKV